MSEAKAIARVVRSVIDTLKRREWRVTTGWSNKSLSRYVYARKERKSLKIRISDHPPNQNTKCDLCYYPRSYQQKRLAKYLDRQKSRYRLKKRPPK